MRDAVEAGSVSSLRASHEPGRGRFVSKSDHMLGAVSLNLGPFLFRAAALIRMDALICRPAPPPKRPWVPQAGAVGRGSGWTLIILNDSNSGGGSRDRSDGWRACSTEPEDRMSHKCVSGGKLCAVAVFDCVVMAGGEHEAGAAARHVPGELSGAGLWGLDQGA